MARPDSHRLPAIFDLLSGRRGPLRSALELLRRIRFGERMLKTAFGAFIAWELGRLIPGNPHPYLAPLTVILVMQATIAQSVTYATQRGIGIAIGVIVAILVVESAGVHGWSIAIVVLVSLAVGARLKIGTQATQQVAVSALLVMLLGAAANEFEYALLRVLDTIVGTVVALAMNAVFVPPSHVPTARRSLEALAFDVAGTLHELAASVRSPLVESVARVNLARARAVAAAASRTASAITQAELSLKYHPFAGQERETLAQLNAAGTTLDHVVIQTRVIARVLVEIAASPAPDAGRWIDPARMGDAIADVLDATAHVLELFGTLAAGPDQGGTFGMALRAAEERRVAAHSRATGSRGERLPPDWALTGEILAVAARIGAEFRVNTCDSEPRSTVPEIIPASE